MALCLCTVKQTTWSRLAFWALLVGVGASLGGCDQAEKTRKVIDQRAGEAQQSLDKAAQPPQQHDYNPLTVTQKVWGGATALRMQHGMPLPVRYETTRGITLVSAEPMTLTDLANAIGAQTGIPMRLSALSAPGKAAASAASASPALGATSGVFVPASAGGSANSGGLPTEGMPVSYEGSLSGLMERISAFYGVSWRYDGSSILVSRFQTRVFTIEALPGTQEVNEGMQDDSSSGGGGGSSGGGSSGSSGSSGGGSSSSSNTLTQNSKIKIEFAYWKELTDVLNSIVGSQGSVIVSQTIGTVTVTTTPDVMQTVADYLGKENARMSRQIAINVQVYSVNLQQSEDFTVAFSGFLKNLSKFSGLNYTSAAAPSLTNTGINSSSLGSLSVAILNGANDPTAHAGDVFNALSTIGDTTTVAQFPMVTMNNRPISRRVGKDTTYISQVSSNTTASVTAVTSNTVTTSIVHEGFSLQLTPRLLDDGRILLQYSLSLISLNGSLAPDATYKISLPVTNNRIFVQQSMLRSGSTLIIGGVDQEDLAQNKNGTGSPDNFLLGGGSSSNNNRLMLFMAITPQVLDDIGPSNVSYGGGGEHN